jgi:hypothetical protein
MADESLEKRVAALEQEVARLRELIEANKQEERPGWEKIVGSFANDPIYEEAMRLGREYRESQRPKSRRTSTRRNRGKGNK